MQTATAKGAAAAAKRPARDESDPRYRRARQAYLRLLSEGRLSCGESCPLRAVGHCAERCW